MAVLNRMKKPAMATCALCGKPLKSTDTWLIEERKYCGPCSQKIWNERSALAARKTDEKILALIRGQRYLIHHADEADYAYLGTDGVCIEVLNDTDSGSLYIDREDEYTLSFDCHHTHYACTADEDICSMLETIGGILRNSICAVSVGTRDKTGQFVSSGSCFAPADMAKDAGSLKDLFPPIAGCLFACGGCTEMRIQFWNSAMSKTIPVLPMG